jgi:hypothetical protein
LTSVLNGQFIESVPDQSFITLPNETIMDSSINKPGSNKRNQIVGGTLGTVAGLIIVGVILFFLRRQRRVQRTEGEEFEESMQTPSLIENSPTNATMIAPYSMGSSKAQLMMMSDEGGPSVVSPSSNSGSRAGETSARSDLGQQQMRLVPQRPAHLHVTNLAPGEEKPLPSPMTPRLQPERRQTQGQDQILRREVEQLRMEMEAIRAGQQQQPNVTEEPPPRYAESN